MTLNKAYSIEIRKNQDKLFTVLVNEVVVLDDLTAEDLREVNIVQIIEFYEEA